MNASKCSHSFDQGFLSGWLPLVCLVIYIIAFSFGMGPITWSMNVELHSREGFVYPSIVDISFIFIKKSKRWTLQPFFSAQSVMSSTGVLCNFVFAFCMGKFASNIQTAINKSGLYFLAAGVNIFGLIFCMIFVPETKGKTPEEIKKYFQKGFQKIPTWSRHHNKITNPQN